MGSNCGEYGSNGLYVSRAFYASSYDMYPESVTQFDLLAHIRSYKVEHTRHANVKSAQVKRLDKPQGVSKLAGFSTWTKVRTIAIRYLLANDTSRCLIEEARTPKFGHLMNHRLRVKFTFSDSLARSLARSCGHSTRCFVLDALETHIYSITTPYISAAHPSHSRGLVHVSRWNV